VTRRVVRVSSDGPPLLDVFSAARAGPRERLSLAQMEHIWRTVRRVPEVMVKVTGGGRSVRAVAAHLAYISHYGEVELESDRAEHVSDDGQRELLNTWHVELSAGQYRPKGTARSVASGIKLVHNVVLAMPAGTPPHKVLAAAKHFAREKFGAQHRYLMALHTHQQHPHVHLVVNALREKLDGVVRELSQAQAISDPARASLLKSREAVVAGWNAVAAKLEAQGEIVLGGEVRYFAMHLPPVLTDRERLAAELLQYAKERRSARTRGDDRVRDRTLERTR